ncbi:ABC transporter substrate-binding protein [Halomicrobium sp. LC1Hm]|uniref:ABC transporter substrate-binding protein n=1 Tax=Halomicrobium sp. LC1Hm TaxID=2610902 RepID=UPI0012982FD8|nr:ABC transporter substrate-binding protein [Halomicrobium sp. LC1Hm]
MVANRNRQESGERSQRRVSRRRLLTVTASGAAALAGCSGDGSTTTSTDGSGDSSTPAPDAEPRDSELVRKVGRIPTDVNWNLFGPDLPWNLARGLYHVTRPTQLWVLDDWSYDTDEQIETWTFPDNLTWWNGDQVTAEHQYISDEISRLQNPEGSSMKRVWTEDDRTLKREYKKPQNPTILKESSTGTFLAAHPSLYQEWLEKYQDAADQSARDSVTQELEKFKVTSTEILDNGLGNGPYELTEVNNQAMVFEVRTDHPWYQDNQVETYRVRAIKEGGSIIKKQDKLDLGRGLLKSSFTGPDHLQNITESRSVQLRKVAFNHTNEHLQKRKVRQALAHLIDWNSIIANQQPQAAAVPKQTGMGKRMAKQWLGDELYGKMADYPITADPDGATKYLNEAGYSKQGGEWVDPDGKTVSFNMLSINWGAFTKGARTVNSQMNQFGFDMNFEGVSGGVYYKRARNQMDYDLTFFFHNNFLNHPISYFRSSQIGGLRLANLENYGTQLPKWLDEGKERSPFNGMPLTPEIPTEPGAKEISGDGEQINLWELYDETLSAESEAQTRENVRLLARYWNYDLPHLVILQPKAGFWGDTKDFDMPVDDETYEIYAGMHAALKRGAIKHKYK